MIVIRLKISSAKVLYKCVWLFLLTCMKSATNALVDRGRLLQRPTQKISQASV